MSSFTGFSFNWFSKREFGKLTNGILESGGPVRPVPSPSLPLSSLAK